MPFKTVKDFIRLESAGGILLFIAAIIALLLDNTAFSVHYQSLLTTHLSLKFGDFGVDEPVILWVNDGLMTVFFFLIGLELKREMLVGELQSIRNILTPVAAAIGGMLVPIAIYLHFNHHLKPAMFGWAIPTATDIAFALGILSILKSRIPDSLKVFLTALAIFDDIGAIIIIAIFYSNHISRVALLFVCLWMFILFLLNRRGVTNYVPYVIVGFLLWLSILQAGLHPTLAGVVLAFGIPLEDPRNPEVSPLRTLESHLHPWVSFCILPLFAFANAGVRFHSMNMNMLMHNTVIGIVLGLFLGKPIGIMSATWIAVKTKLGSLPDKVNWKQIYGMSLICGVGFTMSLFIGTLAFEEYSKYYMSILRVGVLAGSLLSGIAGYLVLRYWGSNTATPQNWEQPQPETQVKISST